MRDFRKILSLILAIAMMLSTGISIMANEPKEEKEHKVNFVFSPDIDPKEYDIYLEGRYYDEKGESIKQEIRKGDKVKPGTRLEENYELGCSYFVDGKKIDYDYEMPNEDITIFVTPKVRHGKDYILNYDIDEKPVEWSTVTLEAGKGEFIRNGRYENLPQYLSEIKLYVNPVRKVYLSRKNQRTEYYGKYILESPMDKITSNEIIGVFDKDSTVTIEYKDYKTVTLVLNKHNNSTEEITVNVDAKYSDILEKIRKNETDLEENEKFVCWSPSNLEEYGWKYNEYVSIYPYIYDKKYDKIKALDYENTDVVNFVPENGKINLYEIVTDEKNPITIEGTVYENTEKNDLEKYHLQLSDIYLTKAKSDLSYRRILGLGEETTEKYYDIDININDLNKRLELNLDDKITQDKVIARKYVKGNHKYINKPEASFYVYSDPKLDYDNEANPTLDLTHMVVAIVDGNTRKLVPYEKFGEYNITAEPKNGTLLTYEYNKKSIKVTRKGSPDKFAFTTKPLKVLNDGFDVTAINKIEVSTYPKLKYKIVKEPSETKLDLNALVLKLTSNSTIEQNKEVSRYIPYEDLKQYGINLIIVDSNESSKDKDANNDTTLELSDNGKKIIAYKDDNTKCEVGTLVIKDGVFREEKTNKIEVKKAPKTEYIVGDGIDLSKLVLEFTDSNKNKKEYNYDDLVKSNFTFSLCGKDDVVEQPEQPEKPVEPEKPGEETPDEPGKPNNPTEPGTNPEEPKEPEKPADPEKPEKPADPEKPNEPGTEPEKPIEPTNPEQPDPENPTEPITEPITEPTDPNATSLLGAEIYSAEDAEEADKTVDEDSNEESENPIETNETEDGPNCTPIENVTALQLIDNEKDIVVHGPLNSNNNIINSFEEKFKISVKDKLRISYEFVSKDGTELPEDVKKLLPENELIKRDGDFKAEPLDVTKVKVSNGVWNFDGWDKDTIEKVQESTTITGTWTFTKNPDPVVPDDPDTPDVPVTPEEPDDETEPYYPGYDYFRPFNPDRSYRGRHKAGNQKKEEPKKKTEETKPVLSEDKDYGFDIKDGNLPINLTDIPAGEVGDAIRNMVSRGILVGMTETEFQGEIGITRAMIGEVLMRMSKDKSLGDAPFSDVKPTDWFYDSVRWGVKHNIFKGYPDGTFRPNQNVSRQEFATIISRFLQMKGVNMPQIKSFEYEDAKRIPMWSAAQVIEMNGTGLIVGKTETVYDAKGDYSRNELALTLNRIVNWIVQHSK